MTRLTISQPGKKLREENQNIEKTFQKASLTKVERENFRVCQLEAVWPSW